MSSADIAEDIKASKEKISNEVGQLLWLKDVVPTTTRQRPTTLG